MEVHAQDIHAGVPASKFEVGERVVVHLDKGPSRMGTIVEKFPLFKMYSVQFGTGKISSKKLVHEYQVESSQQTLQLR